MNTKIIKFDINKNLYNTLIAKQGDTKSRFLLFNLLDGSIPFSLENRSVRVYAVKPDRTEVFNDLIITDAAKGYCILELTTQILAVAGTVKLELMVIEEDKKLTSSIFYMDVKASINSEKAVVSTNEFGALLTALSSLNEYDNYKKEIAAARDGEANLLTKVKKIDEQLDNIAHDGFKWRELDSAYISIIMDDNRADVLNVATICNSYGIPLCCSVIGAVCRTRLTDLKAIQDGFGGEILSHGYNSTFLNPSTNSGSDYITEIIGSKEELYANGLTVYGFKKPGNSIYTGYEQVVEDNYLYGTNLFGNESLYGNDCTPYAINTIYIGSQTTEQLKTIMDNAIKNKKWVLFYAHTIDGSETGVDETKLRYICQYAKDNNIKPTTLKDFYYKFGELNFNLKDRFLNNTVNSLAKVKSSNLDKHYLVLQANSEIVCSSTGTIDNLIFTKMNGNGISYNTTTGEIQLRKKALYRVSIEYHMTSGNGSNDYNGQIGFYVNGGGIDNLNGKFNLDSYGKFRTYQSSYIISKDYDDILIPKIFKNIPIDIIVGKFSRVIVEEI